MDPRSQIRGLGDPREADPYLRPSKLRTLFKWSLNISLMSGLLGVMSYSWWWHNERDRAKKRIMSQVKQEIRENKLQYTNKEYIDKVNEKLDEWGDDLIKTGKDPVANWMMNRGFAEDIRKDQSSS